MWEAARICPAPWKLTFDLLTSKVVSESRVMWAISVPILVFLRLSVLDLGLMYATDRCRIKMYPQNGRSLDYVARFKLWHTSTGLDEAWHFKFGTQMDSPRNINYPKSPLTNDLPMTLLHITALPRCL